MPSDAKLKPSGIAVTRKIRNMRSKINANCQTNPQTNWSEHIPNGICVWPRLLTEESASAYLSLPPATFRAGADAGSFPAPLVIADERLWDRAALDRAIDAQSWAEQQRPRVTKRESRKEHVAEVHRPASAPGISAASGEAAPASLMPLPAVSVLASPAVVPTAPAAPPPPPPTWPARMRREAASTYLLEVHGISRTVATLAKLATVGGGPVFQKDGRFPIYRREDLDAWAATQLSAPVQSTAELPRRPSREKQP